MTGISLSLNVLLPAVVKSKFGFLLKIHQHYL